MSGDPRKFATEASIAELRRQYAALLKAAKEEAEGRVKAYTKGHTRFFPAKMTRKGLDEIKTVFTRAYVQTVGTRFAQLQRLNHKLAKVDPRWIKRTSAEIIETPDIYWGGSKI